MTPKTRVYDLAKQYGMTGQDLAAKLRDLGFSQVKSHMTALNDFEVMEIQGRLEAYGIVGETETKSDETRVGGLVIRRKKKKKKEEAEAPEPAADAPAPTPVLEEVAPVEEPAPEEPQAEPQPEAAAPVASEAVEEPAAPVAPEAEAPVAAPEPPAVEEAAPVAEVEAPPEEPLSVEPEVAEVEPAAAEPAPVEAAESAEVVEAEAPEEPAAPEAAPVAAAETPAAVSAETPEEAAPEAGGEGATGEDGEIVRPGDKRRPAKVVGFIDLSKIQPTPVKKPESRRLRSSDDVAPDVQPTMGRNRRSAFQRGDTMRGDLTAAQLREKEAGRFLRRRGPQRGGPGGRRGGGGHGRSAHSAGNVSPHAGSLVSVEEPVTIKKLAEQLSIKANELLKVAFRQMGFGAVNINSLLDAETAELLAGEFDVEIEIVREVEAEEALMNVLEEKRGNVEESDLETRPPVIAFMGHVDHGKTTLIDSIRKSQIADGESGGITQHIGAYQVTNDHGHTLTILDTPGHEAFTAMRARGANAVDVAVVVVAADDGVKPQTEEAINHVRAAKTPIVVALNKMDKAEANPEKVKTELSSLDLAPEDWGGTTAMMPISALRGEGVEDLLERVFLESEVLELKCHSDGPASGVVLEAEIQHGKGKVAHLLIQDGSLRQGDVILAGEGYGKVRSIHDDRDGVLKEAGPSKPVEVTGLNELPNVGDHFHVVESLEQAKEVAEERSRKHRMMSLAERRSVSSENLIAAVAESKRTLINIILRADVQGSLEVLRHQLGQLTHDEVEVKLVQSGVGEVVESDVDLAITSGSTILAFHVGTNSKARPLAERQGIEILQFNVIYELLDYVKARMEGSLAPAVGEEVTGHLEIRRVFKSSRFGNIAGCYVIDGSAFRDSRVRLLRDGVVVHTGSLSGLRREKDDAKEVREGFECGALIRDYNDIKEGDIIECFRMVETKRLLEI